VYSRVLGLATEVEVGVDEGLAKASAIRCDFLTLMFKARLTRFVATLPAAKLHELDAALQRALGIGS
jgi:mRNA-degrading endonuclease toxin of MazEF toxin-antitoxin module